MANVDLVMPKMGESIIEATILNWVKNVGDSVEEDETILEIATDKVDSEIPSPVDGVITEILFDKDAVVPVGTIIAKIAVENGAAVQDTPAVVASEPAAQQPVQPTPAAQLESNVARVKQEIAQPAIQNQSEGRFYSPLVKSIAKSESIPQAELDQIPGSGAHGRVTKQDILSYVANRSSGSNVQTPIAAPSVPLATTNSQVAQSTASVSSAPSPSPLISGEDEIIQMDRMRKLIADHMVMSKQTSPHVTSFVEVDVTNIVKWREQNKKGYLEKYGEKITYTPIFMEAVAKAILDFPLVNVSVDGDKIIKKKNINIGMATALPSGNLIVPVIKQADRLSLTGLTSAVNDLSNRARNNKLKPEDIQGGTFTLTNVGTFGNVMGTPIINQPQVAILAVGAIRKKPAVVETEYGDLIAVRNMMFCSLSYDHRVVDGFLGGSFLRRIGDYLEGFDAHRGV